MQERSVFLVVAKIRAKAEAVETLAAMFAEMVAWVVRNESATLDYRCGRSTDDPNLFVFLERYASQLAFREHTASEKFLELAAGIQGLVEGAIEIETYDELTSEA